MTMEAKMRVMQPQVRHSYAGRHWKLEEQRKHSVLERLEKCSPADTSIST